MKAIVQERYGAPRDVLGERIVDRPAIGQKEVLVRVRAAALHAGDTFAVRGSPFMVRVATGLRRPRPGIPGLDVSGVVEAVGAAVTGFRPGDEVFGSCAGACAEYAKAKATDLAKKPSRLSFEQAAAIPTSALAALHGLRAGRLRAGQKVLVIGAAGGVGTFAVQIAKAIGAVVTGVCSTRNIELVRSLGADHVVDYTREDFSRGAARYDLIFDNVEDRRLGDVRRALTPEGTLVLNSGTGAGGMAMMVRLVWPLVVSPFVRHDLRRFLSMPNAADLAYLAALAGEGTLRPVVERTYPLAETPAAIAHVETRHARGKVVIAVTA